MSVITYTLPNGLTVWLDEDHTQTKVIGTVVVKAGAKDSPNTGIPHYFEHIMFKGTDKIGTVDYQRELPILQEIEEKYAELNGTKDEAQRLEIQKEINALSVKAATYAIPNEFNALTTKYGGSGLNAGTGWDQTLYFNTFPPQYLEQWCYLNSERLLSPVFRLFQSELETVYEEKNLYADRVGNDAMERIIDRFAAPHPYRYPIIGSTENLKNPNLKEMKAFFDEYYVAGNMGLILCGDFDVERVKPLIEKTFGRLKPGQPNRPELPQPKPFKGVEKFTVLYPVKFLKANIMLWRTVPAGHPDEAALDLGMLLFSNDGETGLLDQLTVSNKLMMATGKLLTMNDLGAAALMVVPNLPFGSLRKAQGRVMQVLERVKQGNFSDDLFETLKKEMLQKYLTSMEELDKRSRILGALFTRGEAPTALEEKARVISQLTKEDVVKVLNKYLGPDYLFITKKTGKYPADKIAKPPFAPLPFVNHGKSSSFAKFLETLPVDKSRHNAIDMAKEAQPFPLQSPLANLYVEPNPHNAIFTLSMVFQKGVYEVPEADYLDTYLSLIDVGGYSANGYKEALHKLGSSLQMESTNETFTFTLTGFDEQLAETVALFSLLLKQPKHDKSKLAKLVSLKKLNDRVLLNSPSDIARILGEWVMYREKAATQQELTLSQVKRLKVQKLAKALEEITQTELDVHYVGNHSAEKVAELLNQHLPISKVTLPTHNPLVIEPVPAVHPTIYFLPHSKALQAIIKSFTILPPLKTAKERALTTLYNAYLGGGMSSLLFQEIREFRSLAYNASSRLYPTPMNDTISPFILETTLHTQADKAIEALSYLMEVLDSVPDDDQRVEASKSTLKNIAYNGYPSFREKTKNIVRLRRRGFQEDSSTWILNNIPEITPVELLEDYLHRIEPCRRVYAVVGDPDSIDIQALERIAKVELIDARSLIE